MISSLLGICLKKIASSRPGPKNSEELNEALAKAKNSKNRTFLSLESGRLQSM